MTANLNPPQSISNAQDKIAFPTQPQYQPKPDGFAVAANYVAMVPSGQIFDSSFKIGQVWYKHFGLGQVIKGLDEGILSMKIGGKRRLYIPGSLAFPKGLNSAPGRPRVAPSSPVVFDVSLEYVPGLDIEED
ncbi:peptidyl-prolyl cis-trans isomerase FKBP16-3, chloroplastic-like [Malus sylvestris]|uniref:peptidyl-prolyl cis-trans isomerase FKBP16-3, chloroplastic-like n=1 Tax=Malus sylvestris TaxID=3752 RepID=UPI0021ACA6D0|nr:peptidyl-prolyl cis-trans isomerase FKBP16-3, chloroplastic-like [Malus sylvestris]